CAPELISVTLLERVRSLKTIRRGEIMRSARAAAGKPPQSPATSRAIASTDMSFFMVQLPCTNPALPCGQDILIINHIQRTCAGITPVRVIPHRRTVRAQCGPYMQGGVTAGVRDKRGRGIREILKRKRCAA